MGNSSWSSDTYSSIKKDYSTKTRAQVFTSKAVHADLDPKGLKVRESRDSSEHPESLAIMVFLDVTGSMGTIPEHLIKHKLGALMETLHTHGLKDAHVMFGAIGDLDVDSGPLQVGQFEAGTTELDQCLTKIWIEGGGGGNSHESYSLPWLVGARHTSIDCFEKRGVKGFLFTIGDEPIGSVEDGNRVKDLMGYSENTGDLKTADLLQEARRMYHVYHLRIGNSYSADSWKALMPENVIQVDDSDTVAEIIASTVALVHGTDLKDIVKNFDDKTAASVGTALAVINKSVTKVSKQEGIVAL